MRLALYQPEIPQNAGTLLRLGACLGVGVSIIEPCGFILDDQRLRRAGMDYIERVNLTRHMSWDIFLKDMQTNGERLVLLDTKATTSYLDFDFQKNDVLILGQESSGVPPEVFSQIPYNVKIPLKEDCRSLNVAIAASMVLGEALRQTNGFLF